EAQYCTFVRGSRCTMGVSNGTEGLEVPADYAFGSGRTAFTYVSRASGASLELRLSYYPRAHRWDYTPGLRATGHLNAPLGLTLDPKSEAACFGCHATAVVSGPQGLEPEHSLLGIGCESCHGPGREHVAAVRRRDPDL